MRHDMDALIDLIRAVQVQAIADARAGYATTTVLPDGEATIAAGEWLALTGAASALTPRPAPAPRVPAAVTVPERCAADGPLFRRGAVEVTLTRGPRMVYAVTVAGVVVETATCAPQSWKRTQLAVLRRAEALAQAH
jgi:hypothetical protein